jgi:hypothetical protein
MTRKRNAKKPAYDAWRDKHKVLDFSDKQTAEMVEWAKSPAFSVITALSDLIDQDWSVKVSPIVNSKKVYVTLQHKDPDDEYSEISFGFRWTKTITCYVVAAYVAVVMYERGELLADAPDTVIDPLDFMT